MYKKLLLLITTLSISAPLSAQQKQACPATTPGAKMPLTYSAKPTVAAITACDLMTRLYIYAADSMLGREAGTADALRATAYLEREVRRLGLKPGGDNGTFFQAIAVTARSVNPASSITVGSNTFRLNSDFVTQPGTTDRKVLGDVIFGGTLGDTVNTISAEQAKGKIVVVVPPAGGRGAFGRGGRGGFGGPNPLSGAAAIVTVQQTIQPSRVQMILNDTVQTEGQAAYLTANPSVGGRGGGRGGRGGVGAQPLSVTVTPAVATALLAGKAVSVAKPGDTGAQATIDIQVQTLPAPTRNVIAILPGSDPVLKNQYIVIGAHSDHVGFGRGSQIEHDSLKAYNIVARVEGADTRGGGEPTPEQWARINAIKDSLRKIYPARVDSISNGADDDGSGSVSVLEIAEAFAKGTVKPKRSIIFIWQMGEEKGLWGSQWFTNHPTIPRDSIVADLNLDMVGRGEATDVTGRGKENEELFGAPNYLQLVGSRRLSTELGDIAEAVSAKQPMPFKFDYSMDANGHPQNIYCRSDHANYARYGIPVIFFTTGGHADYHQVTDEPQYIQYPHMARVAQLVFDIAVKVGDLDHRVTVDKPKPDSPFGRCQQ